jgi:hypothetical protein
MTVVVAATASAQAGESIEQRARGWLLGHVRVFLHTHPDATTEEVEEKARRLHESIPLIRDNMRLTDALRFASAEHLRVDAMRIWDAR